MSSRSLNNSLVLSSPLVTHLDTTHKQGQSPLFGKLPREIRNLIFDLALALDPIGLTSMELIPHSTKAGKPRNNVHPRIGLLQTCRLVYVETYLASLQLNALTYKLHCLYYSMEHVTPMKNRNELVAPVNDKLLWMHQWQRQILQTVHIHAMICDRPWPGAFHDAIIKSIDTLSPDLNDLKVLHISVWGDPSTFTSTPIGLSWEWFLHLSVFRIADLPNQYPTLRAVIIEFGAPLEHIQMLGDMIEELLTGDYRVPEGQQLVIDLDSISDLGWTMGFGRIPEGMVSIAIRWNRIANV